MVRIDSPEMVDLLERGASCSPLPTATVESPSVQGQLGNVSVINFLTNVPAGHGGAIVVDAQSVQLYIVAEIVLRNLYVAHNTAEVGGEPLKLLGESLTDCSTQADSLSIFLIFTGTEAVAVHVSQPFTACSSVRD